MHNKLAYYICVYTYYFHYLTNNCHTKYLHNNTQICIVVYCNNNHRKINKMLKVRMETTAWYYSRIAKKLYNIRYLNEYLISQVENFLIFSLLIWYNKIHRQHVWWRCLYCIMYIIYCLRKWIVLYFCRIVYNFLWEKISLILRTKPFF